MKQPRTICVFINVLKVEYMRYRSLLNPKTARQIGIPALELAFDMPADGWNL